MTTGPNPPNRPTHHSALPPRDDREALSALFDGELEPDAVRFALKRMEHDTAWRDACGRWQLIGDVLRGQADAAAPAGFADSVREAVAAQVQADRAVGSGSPSPSFLLDGLPAPIARRRGWLGGTAVAASVALAALFVMRPGSQVSPPAGEPRLAAEPARATVPATGPANALPTQAPSLSPARAIDAPARRVAGAAAASTRRPRGPSLAPTSTPEPPSTLRGMSAPVQGEAATPAAIASAPVIPVEPEALFAPAGDIVTRPWPRAVLPGSATQSLTVGFGDGAAPSPSFYPFEPRLPPEQASPPAEPQR